MRRLWMAVAAVGVLVGAGGAGRQAEEVALVEAVAERVGVGWEWEGRRWAMRRCRLAFPAAGNGC